MPLSGFLKCASSSSSSCSKKGPLCLVLSKNNPSNPPGEGACDFCFLPSSVLSSSLDLPIFLGGPPNSSGTVTPESLRLRNIFSKVASSENFNL